MGLGQNSVSDLPDCKKISLRWQNTITMKPARQAVSDHQSLTQCAANHHVEGGLHRTGSTELAMNHGLDEGA